MFAHVGAQALRGRSFTAEIAESAENGNGEFGSRSHSESLRVLRDLCGKFVLCRGALWSRADWMCEPYHSAQPSSACPVLIIIGAINNRVTGKSGAWRSPDLPGPVAQSRHSRAGGNPLRAADTGSPLDARLSGHDSYLRLRATDRSGRGPASLAHRDGAAEMLRVRDRLDRQNK